MTTRAQIEANRRNALASTGPRTSSGKERSRMNALKHGFTAHTTLLADEDPGEFAELHLRLWEALTPHGALEVELTERIIAQAWRLRRIIRFDPVGVVMAEHGEELLRDCVVQDAVAKMSRYEITLENSFFRALDRLRDAQERRPPYLRGQQTPHPSRKSDVDDDKRPLWGPQ